MRLTAFEFRDVGPIKNIAVDGLADVVVLAGPNGVGKTSINNAILNLARESRVLPSRWMVVEATDEREKAAWGKTQLDTRIATDAQMLQRHLQRNQRRNRFYSSFLNFDSDRAVRNVQSMNFSWNITNPYAEEVGWDMGFSQLPNRYNDVRHSLFRLVESQRREIADIAIQNRDSGKKEMALDFPDLLDPFKDAFWQLLAPKRLVEVNVQQQKLFYELNGEKLTLETLSSGEKEVVNIVFDFLLRAPSHSVIVFDEPELHLHPELSYKLLQTLSRIGERNQFIFSSHSPEIISTSLENTVVFVKPPAADRSNQAIIVHRDDRTHHALRTLGQSIGVISLGKKIVLIEGEESSLDKQTYGAILKSDFPEFVLVPVGGKETLRSFENIRDSVLNQTIWGVEFFLLADRDAVHALGQNAVRAGLSGKIRELPRYHLENYFLDAETIVRIFEGMEPEGSWLRDRSQVEAKLREFARSVVPYTVALNISAKVRELGGSVSVMPKGLDGTQDKDALVALVAERVKDERTRIDAALSMDAIAQWIEEDFTRLSGLVSEESERWKVDLPGRIVFNRFASSAAIHPGRLKQLYLAAARETGAFSEITSIFQAFRGASAPTS